MSIGKNIKELRLQHNMSQLEFAKVIGVTDKAVSSWENEIKTPRMGTLQRIADYFNIKKSEIIEGPLSLIMVSEPHTPTETELKQEAWDEVKAQLESSSQGPSETDDVSQDEYDTFDYIEEHQKENMQLVKFVHEKFKSDPNFTREDATRLFLELGKKYDKYPKYYMKATNIPDYVLKGRLSREEYPIVEKYREVDDETRKKINQYIDDMHKLYLTEKPADDSTDN